MDCVFAICRLAAQECWAWAHSGAQIVANAAALKRGMKCSAARNYLSGLHFEAAFAVLERIGDEGVEPLADAN